MVTRGACRILVHMRSIAGLALLALFLPLAAFAASINTNDGVEALVREQFEDVPVMVEIARCESKFRQFNAVGEPLYGGAGSLMVGVFQIHSSVHTDFAKAIGRDIDTLEGNLSYARFLYDQEGTTPWRSSADCWGATPAAEGMLISTLTLGSKGPQVLSLQKMLNASGFTIASSGPGSPGEETTIFGPLTQDAVKKFQCAKEIVCSGDASTTGYGAIGPRTRQAFLVLSPTDTKENSKASVAAPAREPVGTERVEVARLQERIEELRRELDTLKQRLAGRQRASLIE